MRSKGFTLIELLVVIAIIAILAAILFPVLVNTKERGRQMKCLANLKQLGMAFRAYADNNGGRFPASSQSTNIPGRPPMWTWTDWCGSTYQYPAYPERGQIWNYTRSKALYLCPTDKGIYPKSPSMKGKYYDYAISYSMNSWISMQNVDESRKRAAIIMLLIHESRKSINDGKFSMWSAEDVPTDVHWDGTTLLYCDGHGRWASYKSLLREKENWNPGW